jgi:transcriptional regulator with XRE-family HTH domain
MYRRRSGLSQIELAERARISSRAISDLERGVRSRAYHPTVEALAVALSLEEEERERFTSAVRRARSLPRSRGRIPADVHEERVHALADLVLTGQHRLISVTGPPGAGKTRLAVDTGRLLAERQSMRMDYVSLEGCSRASELEAVVESLQEPPRPGLEEVPEPYQRARPAREEVPEPYQKPRLLVLDNLEHLLPIDSEVKGFLSRDPALSIFVVSRVGTQMTDEREILLPPP